MAHAEAFEEATANLNLNDEIRMTNGPEAVQQAVDDLGSTTARVPATRGSNRQTIVGHGPLSFVYLRIALEVLANGCHGVWGASRTGPSGSEPDGQSGGLSADIRRYPAISDHRTLVRCRIRLRQGYGATSR